MLEGRAGTWWFWEVRTCLLLICPDAAQCPHGRLPRPRASACCWEGVVAPGHLLLPPQTGWVSLGDGEGQSSWVSASGPTVLRAGTGLWALSPSIPGPSPWPCFGACDGTGRCLLFQTASTAG